MGDTAGKSEVACGQGPGLESCAPEPGIPGFELEGASVSGLGRGEEMGTQVLLG